MFAPNQTLLLIEDDTRLADLMQEYLQQEGYQVLVEGRGDTAVQRIKTEQPDLIILDVMLPGMDGMAVCRQAREFYTQPILMLTAKDEDIDQVLGLELGADDYVIKPVKPRVLLARIQNLLRRQASIDSVQVDKGLRFGDLCIDVQHRSVQLADESVELTSQEFDLLHFLASKAGTVLSRDAIFQALSGIDYDGLDRSVDIRIARLRKLLKDDPAKPRFIKTVRNKGYLFLS
jgi:two-component system response regulator RstA